MASCDQQSLEKNWNLDMKNACHIETTNSEMGELRDELVDFRQETTLTIQSIDSTIKEIADGQTMIFWLVGIILIAVIGETIRLIFKKSNR